MIPFSSVCCCYVHFSEYLTGDVFIFVSQIEGDVLLVCVGRRPYTKRLGLEACVMQCRLTKLYALSYFSKNSKARKMRSLRIGVFMVVLMSFS